MACKKCGSHVMMDVQGKCSDMSSITIPNLEIDHEGYIPYGLGVGGGDYIDFKVCTQCGTIEGWEPLSKADIRFAIYDEDGQSYNVEI